MTSNRTTKPVSISLPPSLIDDVKQEAAQTADSVSRATRQALQEWLSRRKRERQRQEKQAA